MPPKIDIGQQPNRAAEMVRRVRHTCQHYLDVSVPHRAMRWAIFAILCILYVARVVTCGGFHVFTYALAIHILAQLLMLVTPISDPEDVRSSGGGRSAASGASELPTTNAHDGDDEYRPFVPLVQEFVVWKSMAAGVLICLCLTAFKFLDFPVYWPILVLYFIILFVLNMGSRVKHMMRYGYVPWNAGKPKFVPKNNL